MEIATDPSPSPVPSATAAAAPPASSAPSLAAEPALKVQFVDGEGRLSLTDHALSADTVATVAVIDRLEVAIPDLRLPAELAAPAERFHNRRGRFRAATISFTPTQLAALLAQRPLAATGLSGVQLHLDGVGGLRVRGQARLGDRQADFSARLALARTGQRHLRVTAEDVLIFGYLPVPAPVVAGALISAAVSGGGPSSPARPSVRWRAELDVLDLALLEIFVAHGYRLPELSAARLESVAASSERVLLVFGEGTDLVEPPASTQDAAVAARLDEADGLLARGDYLTALACLRRGEPGAEADPRTARRTLEILVAGSGTLGEADALAARLLAADPSSLPALLARAVVAGEKGDLLRAIDLYMRVATLADGQDRPDDAACARAAALRFRRLADPAGASGAAIPVPVARAESSGSLKARALTARCDELLAQGRFDEADELFSQRIDHAVDEATAARLVTERARVRQKGAGAAAALAILRALPPRTAPQEALVLRAELGERQDSADDALPALDELAVRARAAGDGGGAQALDLRAEALRTRLSQRAPTPTDQLEETLAANPTDAAAAEELATIYMRLDDARERIEALASLLRRALGLSPDRRKEIYANLGETAEAIGDLEQAEQAYWRAATIEPEPELRANYMTAHARILLARGDVQTALAELEEAVARVPTHAGALALLADTVFRLEDWGRARQVYAALEEAPGAADVISRELLMLRRAELAETAGDDVEAETCYREVAILNPRHIDARRVLAEIALRRQDLGGGALRLEEVLRLLPLDALPELLDVRQSLGAVYVQLGDWGSARYYLELVLAQDPARLTALDLLIGAYLRLGLPREAAAACERLARLYVDPGKRARVLYRKGEILRVELGDEDAAFEAFLRASDVDPRFAPTMIRLVEYFWRQGDYTALAEVASELRRNLAASAAQDPPLAVHIALGCALAGQPLPGPSPLNDVAWDPALAAQALAEVAAHPVEQPLPALDLAVDTLATWGQKGMSTGLPGALATLLAADPSSPGPARALARLVDQQGREALARVLYTLLVFVDPNDGVAERLATLGPAALPPPEALEAGGATVHADGAGPLRRVLTAVAAALQGFEAPMLPSGGENLRPARAAGLRRLGQLLRTPPFAASVLPGPAQTRGPVVVAPTRPAMLVVSPEGAQLAEREWGFAAAHALEELRSGLASLWGLGPDELRGFLQGLQAALTDGAVPDHPRARAAFSWFTTSDAATELPVGDERVALARDVTDALASETPWESFLRGGAHTANRIGLLVCASPLDALRALARGDVLIAAAQREQDDEAIREARREFLRTAVVRELLRYALSPAYEQAVAPPPAA